MSKINKVRPGKSLRALLAMWFLVFSLVPVLIVAFSSLYEFQKTFQKELQDRLEANAREMNNLLQESEKYIQNFCKTLAQDPQVIFNLSTNEVGKLRESTTIALSSSAIQEASFFDREGKLVMALEKNEVGSIQSLLNLESGDVFLPPNLLADLNHNKFIQVRDLNRGILKLTTYYKVSGEDGRLGGYASASVKITNTNIYQIKNKLKVDLVFFNPTSEELLSSKELFYRSRSFYENFILKDQKYAEFVDGEQKNAIYFENIGSKVHPLYAGFISGKEQITATMAGISKTIFTVIGIVVVLVILVLLSVSKSILKPLNRLVNASEKISKGQYGAQIPMETGTEIGNLTESFNKMSEEIALTQDALQQKLTELEDTNKELQQTQSQLVQSAKMAGLGQLVAGVAHELNNPIGFIYSNMNHLREYADSLIHLVNIAESEPKKLKAEMKNVDYDYIAKDLPKLIHSCEEGALRVRNIVMDLRTFSRTDNKQKEEYDLEEGLDNTLNLLSNEIKNRIEVVKNYARIPKVLCYSSQMNQVFMNILSNACQAIEGSGKIWIRTAVEKNKVAIYIKDSGPGIKKEILEKIFNPFFTTKPVGKGTGLGLSISYGIIEKHGGTLDVVSQEGSGVEFIIHLPI